MLMGMNQAAPEQTISRILQGDLEVRVFGRTTVLSFALCLGASLASAQSVYFGVGTTQVGSRGQAIDTFGTGNTSIHLQWVVRSAKSAAIHDYSSFRSRRRNQFPFLASGLCRLQLSSDVYD